MEVKSCNRPSCTQKNPQPITCFFRDKGFSSGYRGECKSCRAVVKKRWNQNNKEKWAAYMRKFRAEHPLSAKAKAHGKNRVMRCRYGMDLGEYNARLTAQDNRCAICQKHVSEMNKSLVVDHCHKTGKVRGLLCFSCNRSIAILDSPELMKRAIDYLAQ